MKLHHDTVARIFRISFAVDIAGYYVYIWAGRASRCRCIFDAFKKSGNIFNPEFAANLNPLLTKSGSDEGMVIYKNFRGQDPSIEPLLQRRGLRYFLCLFLDLNIR